MLEITYKDYKGDPQRIAYEGKVKIEGTDTGRSVWIHENDQVHFLTLVTNLEAETTHE